MVHGDDLAWGAREFDLFLVDAEVEDMNGTLEGDRARGELGFIELLRRALPFLRAAITDVAKRAGSASSETERRAAIGAFAAQQLSAKKSSEFDRLIPDLMRLLPSLAGWLASASASAALDLRKDPISRAVTAAEAVLASHGDKPREHKNRVLFLGPDANATTTLRDQLRRFLAWDSIVDDAEELNLDKHHEKEAKKNLEEANARVDASIREAYRLLLVPMQDPSAPDGLTKVLWEDEALSLSGSSFDREIERATREREWVIKAWAPPHLRGLLATWFWKDDRPTAPAMKVWLDTCRYLYLPRLLNVDVCTQTVRDGVAHEDLFGYATGEKDDQLEGIVFGGTGGVYVSDSAVLVRADTARAARDGAKAAAVPGTGDRPRPASQPPPSKSGPAGKARGAGLLQTKPRRFHGTISLDAHDPIGNFTEIVQNVVEHFTTQYGTEVALTLDVEARRGDGFETKTVRVVRENAKALKFSTSEFEEE